MDARLIVFFKNPLPGRVKSRLARAIGAVMAAHLYRRLLMRTKTEAERAAAPLPRYAPRRMGQRRRGQAAAPVFYVAGPLGHDVKSLLPIHPVRLQKGKTLGTRMLDACVRENKAGWKKTIIIGSDCPFLDERCIREAFRALRHHDAVIGPARDGGYYLIGFNFPRIASARRGGSRKFMRGQSVKACVARLFRGVRWSGAGVFRLTLARMRSCGLRVKCLKALADWDRVQDIDRRSFEILYPVAQSGRI